MIECSIKSPQSPGQPRSKKNGDPKIAIFTFQINYLSWLPELDSNQRPAD